MVLASSRTSLGLLVWNTAVVIRETFILCVGVDMHVNPVSTILYNPGHIHGVPHLSVQSFGVTLFQGSTANRYNLRNNNPVA